MQAEIRRRIIEMQQLYGTTNAYIADRTGITRAQICNFLNGKCTLTQKNLFKLEEFLEKRDC